MTTTGGFASRPLTIVTGAMVQLADRIGGVLVTKRARCGCYSTYQVMTPSEAAASGLRVVADADDIRAYIHAFGPVEAGRQLLTAARS